MKWVMTGNSDYMGGGGPALFLVCVVLNHREANRTDPTLALTSKHPLQTYKHIAIMTK